MQLYVFRHGIAYEHSEWAGNDDSRPLTDEGKKRTAQVIKALVKTKKLHVDAIWSSPLVRAQQTAQIAADLLSLPVKIVHELESGTQLSRLEKSFSKLKLPEHLMTVGHEPDCGEIIAGLCGDAYENYSLKKAGMAFLEGNFKAGGMKVIWKISPSDVLDD